MRQRRIFSFLLTIFVAASFCLGLAFREVMAAVSPVLLAQGGLPERLAHVRPVSVSGDPKATDVFSRVLSEIKENYYGELPSDQTLTYEAIKGMLRTLDDVYTRFLDPEAFKAMDEENQGEFVGIGAQLEKDSTKDGYIRIHFPLPDTPAAKAGIKPGDVIIKVDGKSVQTKDIGDPKHVDDVVKLIRGPIDTPVTLTLRRKEPKVNKDDPDKFKTFDVTIKRRPVQLPVVEHELKDGDIGYVTLAQFNEIADDKLDQAVKDLQKQGAKALILDLRANPGGLLQAAQEVGSRFVPEGKDIVIIVEKNHESHLKSLPNRPRYNLPVIILANRNSASASEIVSGAVKDWGAGTIVGSTTFGKGLVQTVVPLSDRSAVVITTAKYLTPKRININRSLTARGGIDPDVDVPVTEADFYALNDVQLKKALEILHQRLGDPEKPVVAGQQAAPLPH